MPMVTCWDTQRCNAGQSNGYLAVQPTETLPEQTARLKLTHALLLYKLLLPPASAGFGRPEKNNSVFHAAANGLDRIKLRFQAWETR